MTRLLILLPLLLFVLLATAQTKTATPVSASVVAAVEAITGKHFLPDTVYTALSDEDVTTLAKEPIANWGLAQASGPAMTYYNLVVGTRSYQLVIVKPPTTEFPTATLLRFTNPKSKPEPIARGTLKPKAEEKAK